MPLREHIRALVVASGWSQRELAEKCGVRRQAIAHFLKGANLHIANLEKLLAALGYRLLLNRENGPKQIKARALLQSRIYINKTKLARFCKSHGIAYLAFYGSVLGDHFQKKSDIDVLIDFEKPVTYFYLVDLEQKLQTFLRTSHPVHIVTIKGLSPLLLDEVMSQSEVFYAKAA